MLPFKISRGYMADDIWLGLDLITLAKYALDNPEVFFRNPVHVAEYDLTRPTFDTPSHAV
jgi:hypothetical protein